MLIRILLIVLMQIPANTNKEDTKEQICKYLDFS